MNYFITEILRCRKVLIGRDFYQFRQVKCSRSTLGNRFADWTFCPDGLDEHSVVYSFGVGEDISFDLKLMEQYHLHIHAFDPSPRSVEWVQKLQPIEAFHFYPFGLASQDGSISFSEPAQPGIHSLKMTGESGKGDAGLKTHLLPVHRLSTVLRKLGHERIDLLKMDIEGAEYGVIEDIIDTGIPVSQLLIEFHHRFDGVGIGKTRQAISRLNRAGYKIFNVSASGEEISFIKNCS
jgi:FkbM family methyltransferase